MAEEENITYQMARDIGAMKGKLDNFCETQMQFNKTIVEKHLPRIDSLEESRTTLKGNMKGVGMGAIIGAAVGSGMPTVWQKLASIIGWA